MYLMVYRRGIDKILKLFIKNMTSLRSKSEVKTIIENVGLKAAAVEIGEKERF